MKHVRRGLAVLLAVLLMIPTLPATAEEILSSGPSSKEETLAETDSEAEESSGEEIPEEETSEEKPSGEEEPPKEELSKEEEPAKEEETPKEEPKEEASQEEKPSGETSGETGDSAQEEEETLKKEEPAKEEETPKKEEPAKEEETPKEEEPAKEEETPKEEEPAKEEETPKKEEPAKEEETPKKEEPAKEEETPKKEEPVKEEETPKEEPAREEKSPKEEKSFEEETPAEEILIDREAFEAEEDLEKADEDPVPDQPSEEIRFNTGDHAYSVVGEKDFKDYEFGDDCFEEDGSYTIQIPEKNPFFPYEVQFTCQGEVTNQWFMTPDDSVEVGGHTFHVSADFDNKAITQISLKVGQDIVVVYPEEKEFKDEDGLSGLSLLPLDERDLRVDLSSYSPPELTMVAFESIFTGEHRLEEGDKLLLKSGWDDYTICSLKDTINLLNRSSILEMIVGENDQLADQNIKYNISIEKEIKDDWLTPTVYVQDSSGKRTSAPIISSDFSNYSWDDYCRLNIGIPKESFREGAETYVGLSTPYSGRFDSLKVYEGEFSSAKEALSGTDITDQIWNANMEKANGGFRIKRDTMLSIVIFDSMDQIIGWLPVEVELYDTEDRIQYAGISDGTEENIKDSYSQEYRDGCLHVTQFLKDGYAVNGTYYVSFEAYKNGKKDSSNVTGAYVGQYSSVAEAISSGAEDIRDALFGNGYAADYSSGVYFTIITGIGSSQEIEQYCIETDRRTPAEDDTPDIIDEKIHVLFDGLVDGNGKSVDVYRVDDDNDSYGDDNYVTFVVHSDADLTKLAPTFYARDGVRLRVGGSNSEEVSGKSFHDFSKGPIKYTAYSKDGKDGRNYWVEVVREENGKGQLYIIGAADESSDMRVENGVLYVTREAILDSNHDYVHDILLTNKGTEAIKNLSAELESDVVELDDYWTLHGKHELPGISADSEYGYDWEQSNMAKLRLRAKESAGGGSDISGKLTIKSGGTVLAVLTLTGTVGDPCITTEQKDIHQAVKFVPYGTPIQNNNRYYSQNTVAYCKESGELPDGMVITAGGELYGVPKEAGKFKFTVRMDNSDYPTSSRKTYTLTVVENTDENVDGATDQGYELTQRIADITKDSSKSQTLVSQGEFDRFRDVYLDGQKLVRDVDYTAEPGSTRVTVSSQTLKKANEPGKHTVGVEFRDGDTLKKAAQNYSNGSAENPNPNPGGGNENPNPNPGGEDENPNPNPGGGNEKPNPNPGGGNGNSGGGSGGGGSTASTASSVNYAAAPPASGADAAGTIRYTVKAGDTLWKISENYYGSGEYWQKIFLDNTDTIQDPNKIFAGQVIVIKPIQISTAAEMSAGGSSYTVQRGDNLWGIAKKVYGNGRLWRRIYEANMGVLTDAGHIYTGQTLVIPR